MFIVVFITLLVVVCCATHVESKSYDWSTGKLILYKMNVVIEFIHSNIEHLY